MHKMDKVKLGSKTKQTKKSKDYVINKEDHKLQKDAIGMSVLYFLMPD